MKIALAQLSSKKGDIDTNINHHKKLIQLALTKGATTIIFPELSITGYEPNLAKSLARGVNDPIFNDFQQISDEQHITIGFGLPIQQTEGISISMLLFSPSLPRQDYSKKYLHSDEEPFFIAGENENIFIKNTKIALAICYELSVEEHEETAIKKGAEIYLASVAKTAEGVKAAHARLATIAKGHKIPVLMVNSIGPNDDFISAGQSAVWNTEGELISALNINEEALLIFDTITNKVVTIIA